MSLFGPDYKPLLDHYEKLVQSLRVELADSKDASLKRESALMDRIMVLTNPQAVKTANSATRFLGVMRGAPPQPGMSGIPEDFNDYPDAPESLPEMARPRDLGARIFARESADVEAHRAAAEARRAKQTVGLAVAPKSDPQPS